MIGPIL